MDSPAERYRSMAMSPDPVARRVARRQLRRFSPTLSRPLGAGVAGRWAHIPLALLFEEAGNTVHERTSGRLDTAHEPLHTSKSGRCVVIDPTKGLWWCRSCRRGGDAASLVMQVRGWSYHRAAAWLVLRFGSARPSETARPRETRP